MASHARSAEADVRAAASPPSPIDPDRTALIVVDVANDVAHPDGAFAASPDIDNSLYENSLPRLLELVDACRSAGMLWVAVCSAYDAEYVPDPMRQRLEMMGILGVASPKGAWGSDVIDELLDRRPGLRVLKSHFSPFSPFAISWIPGISEELDVYLDETVDGDAVRTSSGKPGLVELFGAAASAERSIAIEQLRAGHVAGLDSALKGFGIDTLIVAGGATHVCEDATVAAASQLGYRIIEPFDACGSEDPEKHWVYLHNHGTFMTELCTTNQTISALG